MNKSFDYTIVYVFGPEQCEEKYFKDEVLSREAGEWVKIGETSYRGNLDEVTEDSMKDRAMIRIKNESRTGLPVTSKIYDVFIFPYKVKTDDLIRRRLSREMYNLENSMQNNMQLGEDKYTIPAGQEFVYGVSRSQIKYAVQSFDHDLLTDPDNADHIGDIIKICNNNNKIIQKESQEEDENVAMSKRKPNLNLDMILSEGDEVILTEDGDSKVVLDESGEPIKAKYIGSNKFECREETGRSSYFAKIFLNKYAGKDFKTVNGNEYWTFNGKKLTSLRKNQ
jgi:hypothetical protein